MYSIKPWDGDDFVGAVPTAFKCHFMSNFVFKESAVFSRRLLQASQSESDCPGIHQVMVA